FRPKIGRPATCLLVETQFNEVLTPRFEAQPGALLLDGTKLRRDRPTARAPEPNSGDRSKAHRVFQGLPSGSLARVRPVAERQGEEERLGHDLGVGAHPDREWVGQVGRPIIPSGKRDLRLLRPIVAQAETEWRSLATAARPPFPETRAADRLGLGLRGV